MLTCSSVGDTSISISKNVKRNRLEEICRHLIDNHRLVVGRNSRTPIVIFLQGEGLCNQGSTLGF